MREEGREGGDEEGEVRKEVGRREEGTRRREQGRKRQKHVHDIHTS